MIVFRSSCGGYGDGGIDLLYWRPLHHHVHKVFRRPQRSLQALATERWVISPATTRYIAPAYFLPGQMERIRGTEFGPPEEIIRGLAGGYMSEQSATWGLRLKDVDLVDGTLYTSKGAAPLRSRASSIPLYKRPSAAIGRATFTESWMGNRWFGMWLLDDCLRRLLPEGDESVVRTRARPTDHQRDYEHRLRISATPVDDTHFDELFAFDDEGHNDGKRDRAERMRRLLVGPLSLSRHAGVFLLRGKSGERRFLLNEHKIAEKLSVERGFRVIDPTTSPLSTLIEACAGARVVAGVEGSQLAHGMVVMPPDASLLTIQPSDRVVSVLKVSTDRQGQRYALVVGDGGRDGFRVRWGEVAATLDLLEA